MSPHARGSRRQRVRPRVGVATMGCGLVRVDSAPIRRKALRDCARARSTFHKAEAELTAYEAEDLPAFSRWYRAAFGPDLEAVRTAQEETEALSQTIWRLQAYSHLAECSFANAARFLEEFPEKFARAEARFQEETQRKAEAREREQERVNRRFVGQMLPRLRRYLGAARGDIQAMRREGLPVSEIIEALIAGFGFDEGLWGQELWVMIHDPRVQELFREMKLMTDEVFPEADPQEDVAEERRREAQNAGSVSTVQARIKVLKRELAFALHPDQDGGRDPRKLALWHEVQEAVAVGDVDRLEVIQAHVHLLTGELPPTTPVSRLQALTEMYRESRKALRRRIRTLRHAPEWNFRNRDETERDLLRARLREDVLAERRRAESGLRNVRAEYRELKMRSAVNRFGEAPSLLDLYEDPDGVDFEFEFGPER